MIPKAKPIQLPTISLTIICSLVRQNLQQGTSVRQEITQTRTEMANLLRHHSMLVRQQPMLSRMNTSAETMIFLSCLVRQPHSQFSFTFSDSSRQLRSLNGFWVSYSCGWSSTFYEFSWNLLISWLPLTQLSVSTPILISSGLFSTLGILDMDAIILVEFLSMSICIFFSFSLSCLLFSNMACFFILTSYFFSAILLYSSMSARTMYWLVLQAVPMAARHSYIRGRNRHETRTNFSPRYTIAQTPRAISSKQLVNKQIWYSVMDSMPKQYSVRVKILLRCRSMTRTLARQMLTTQEASTARMPHCQTGIVMLLQVTVGSEAVMAYAQTRIMTMISTVRASRANQGVRKAFSQVFDYFFLLLCLSGKRFSMMIYPMKMDTPKYNTQYPSSQFSSPNTKDRNRPATNTTNVDVSDLTLPSSAFSIQTKMSQTNELTSPTKPRLDPRMKQTSRAQQTRNSKLRKQSTAKMVLGLPDLRKRPYSPPSNILGMYAY